MRLRCLPTQRYSTSNLFAGRDVLVSECINKISYHSQQLHSFWLFQLFIQCFLDFPVENSKLKNCILFSQNFFLINFFLCLKPTVAKYLLNSFILTLDKKSGIIVSFFLFPRSKFIILVLSCPFVKPQSFSVGNSFFFRVNLDKV